MANKYDALVNSITELIGGKNNVSNFAHCITRLRFDIKDKGAVNTQAIESTPGVTGIRWMNNQLQIIIGPDVANVYDQICKKDGYEKAASVSENLDSGDAGCSVKQKKGAAWLIEQISGCVYPLIIVLFATSFVSLLVTLLGLLGVDAASGTMQMLTLVASCGTYFMPVFVGYTAAKKFGGNVLLGMLMGAMLISPTFVEMVTAGESLTFLGIPVTMVNYSGGFLPTMLTVAVMVPVEKFFKKVLPDFVEGVLTPFLTLLVMVPLSFCLIAPSASIAGNYLCDGMIWLFDNLGFLAGGVLAATAPFFVMFGIHLPLVMYAMALYTTQGYDMTIFVSGILGAVVQCGILLAVIIRAKNKDLKSTAAGSLVCAFAGGITEPALYGITLRSKRTIAAMVIGGFAGGCITGLGHVAAYALCSSSIWYLVAFIPGGTANLLWMIAGCLVCLIVSFAVTFFTYNEKELTE